VIIIKVECKEIYCLVCKRFKVVALDITERPKCHSRFKYAPINFAVKKVKTRDIKGVCNSNSNRYLEDVL
jgi:hypothetical protein